MDVTPNRSSVDGGTRAENKVLGRLKHFTPTFTLRLHFTCHPECVYDSARSASKATRHASRRSDVLLPHVYSMGRMPVKRDS